MRLRRADAFPVQRTSQLVLDQPASGARPSPVPALPQKVLAVVSPKATAKGRYGRPQVLLQLLPVAAASAVSQFLSAGSVCRCSRSATAGAMASAHSWAVMAMTRSLLHDDQLVMLPGLP